MEASHKILAWSELKGKPESARSSHSVNAVGHKIYIYGGEEVPRVAYDPHIQVYDLDNNTWTELNQVHGEVPHSRLAHAAAVVGDVLYIIGGRFDNNDVDDVWTFNTKTHTWRRETTTGDEIPTMSYHAAATLGKDIYLFGGCHGHGRLNTVYKLDTEALRWETLTTKSEHLPTPRGGPGLVAVDDKLFVYAGYQGKEELNDLWEFNIATREWRKIEGEGEHPPARSVHTANLIGHTMVAYGGECAPSAQGHMGAGMYLGDTFLYDTRTNRWSKLHPAGSPPSARGWQAATSVPELNAVVLFGGYGGGDRLGDLFIVK